MAAFAKSWRQELADEAFRDLLQKYGAANRFCVRGRRGGLFTESAVASARAPAVRSTPALLTATPHKAANGGHFSPPGFPSKPLGKPPGSQGAPPSSTSAPT